jgi:deoxyribonuclease V
MQADAHGLDVGLDFDMAVFDATVQIPKGKVSTYGAIAKALGDLAAARAVGMCLSRNPRPIVVPCHRVVYADGRVGWYSGKGQGTNHKIELLVEEGVPIHEGVVDMEKALFTDFKVRPVLTELRAEQEEMRRKVKLTGSGKGLKRLAAVDVAYSDEGGCSAMVVVDLETKEVVEERFHRAKAGFPYIPSYLSYRELPFLLPLVEGLADTVVVVDGQGIAHPRRFGIACQLGVRSGLPTIGAAKSVLCGQVDEHGVLRDGDEVLGRRVAGPGRSPYYISIGHKLALDDACDIVSGLLRSGMDPMRRAHQLASAVKEGRR